MKFSGAETGGLEGFFALFVPSCVAKTFCSGWQMIGAA